MGSRNKVLLASLVSMVMVLSFAIGLVPGEIDKSLTGASAAAPAVAITADGATPAGDSLTLEVGESISFSALGVDAGADWSLASNGSAELIDNGDSVTVVARTPGEAGLYLSSADGVDLVNLTIVDAAGEKSLERIRIVVPRDGSRVFVQQGASDVPYAVSSMTNDPNDTFAVRYTLNDDPIGQSIRPPYSVNIGDITQFITGAAATNALTAAAGSYDAYLADPTNPEFEFSTTSNFSVIAADFDPDGNAIPDNPFALDLGPGDSWVAKVAGTTRQVVVAPLVDNFPKVFDIDNDGATASIVDPDDPTRTVTAFVPGGLLQEGQLGLLVLVAGDTLEDTLDDLGDGAIQNQPAQSPVLGSKFAELSIIVSDDGGATFSEIETPLAANVVLQFEGVTALAGDPVRVFRYGTEVTEPPVFINANDGDIWNQVATSVGDGVVTASTNTLSTFAPYSTPEAVIINSVTNIEAGSALVDTSQARATGGETLLVSVSNVDPGDGATLFIDGEAVTILDATASVDGTDFEVVAPVAQVLPALAASSTVPVRIEVNGDADESILTYVGPTVNAISPSFGPATGGTGIAIDGVALTGSSVTIGGNALVNPSVSAAQITGSTPAGDPGTADVVVAYANNYGATLEGGFAYTPTPPTITLNPAWAPDDGGYTVRVNAVMGSSFINPATGVGNEIFFTQASGADGDGADPSQDIPADEVKFIDDTRLDILTPDVRGITKQSASVSLYNVYWTSSAYASSFKQGDPLVSDFFPNFAFIDAAAAVYAIYDIQPPTGPASGGNTVAILGEFGDNLPEFDFGPDEPAEPTGHQLFFGPAFESIGEKTVEFAPQSIEADGDTISLTLYLNRAPDAPDTHPASMSFTVSWDPNVIAIPAPGAIVREDLLNDWYGKSIDRNLQDVPQGIATFVVSGGTTNTPDDPFTEFPTEVTTFNNQLPEAIDEAGTDQENPFPLMTMTFDVTGAAGSSTVLEISNLALADSTAPTPVELQLPDGGSELPIEVRVANGEKQNGQGSDLFNVAFGAQAATVLQAGEVEGEDDDRIEVVAPQVEAAAAAAAFEEKDPFPVDVRVEGAEFDPLADDGRELLFAIRKDGYAYLPGPAITGMSPDIGWVFGAEEVTIDGQNFSDAEEVTVIVEVTDADGTDFSTEVQPSSVTDTEILFTAPPLPLGGNFPNRETDATVLVEFSDGDDDSTVDEAGSFTYVKWDVEGEITTNAFRFATDAGFQEVLVFDGVAHMASKDEVPNGTTPPVGTTPFVPAATTGTLTIPALPPALKDTTDLVFGILRVTREGEEFGIDSDRPEDDIPFPGNEIANIQNFDLHLYQGEDLAEFFVPYEEDTPIADRASIVYNVEGTGLNRGMIPTGAVATWSRPTTFDFTFANRSMNIPAVGDDDKAERVPASMRPTTYALEALLITEDTIPADDDAPVEEVRTHLLNLGAGAFALRSGQAPPRNLVSALLGTTGADQEVSPQGGDEVIITGRNIYWAVNLYAVPAGSAPAFTNPFGEPVERTRDDATGRDVLSFTAPALSVGTYDLYIELPSGAKQGGLVAVDGNLRVADPRDFSGLIGALLTAILGGLVALLGILAGGDTDSSSGPCFIASAAYGTPMGTEIEVLRTFRDSYLLSNPLGAAFVDMYYRVSPAMADVVAQSPVLAAVTRLLLAPVVFAGKMFVAMPAVSFGLLSLSFALAMLRRRFSRGEA